MNNKVKHCYEPLLVYHSELQLTAQSVSAYLVSLLMQYLLQCISQIFHFIFLHP
jgi:hypothetical protein